MSRQWAENRNGDTLCAMKAIRVHAGGEPEVMKLEEAPDPRPGEGEVVVETLSAIAAGELRLADAG